MKRLVLTLSALTTLTSGFASAAQADDGQPLALVSQYEGTVHYTNPLELGSDSRVDRAIAELDQCIAAVDAAKAAGHGDDTEVKVHDSKFYGGKGRMHKEPGHTEEHFAPLGEVRAACESMRAEAGVAMVRRAADEAYDMEQQLRSKGQLDRGTAVVAKMQADTCNKAVETAEARDVPADTLVTTKYGEMQLDEVKDKGCTPIAALAEEASAAGQAAKDAKFAPWKEALSGDKIKTFLDKNMIHFRVRTRGGKELAKPADFARANLWFEGLNSDHPRRWKLKRFQFSGDKLVSTKVITGAGHVPPASAYR